MNDPQRQELMSEDEFKHRRRVLDRLTAGARKFQITPASALSTPRKRTRFLLMLDIFATVLEEYLQDTAADYSAKKPLVAALIKEAGQLLELGSSMSLTQFVVARQGEEHDDFPVTMMLFTEPALADAVEGFLDTIPQSKPPTMKPL